MFLDYNLHKAINQLNKFYFIKGPRASGKTYQVYKYLFVHFLNTGDHFVKLYPTKMEFNNSKVNSIYHQIFKTAKVDFPDMNFMYSKETFSTHTEHAIKIMFKNGTFKKHIFGYELAISSLKRLEQDNKLLYKKLITKELTNLFLDDFNLARLHQSYRMQNISNLNNFLNHLREKEIDFNTIITNNSNSFYDTGIYKRDEIIISKEGEYIW